MAFVAVDERGALTGDVRRPQPKIRGFLTSATESGASIWKMMDVSRHRSVDTLRNYVRSTDLFKEHAGSKFL
jgi:hypothetical protein